jgi:hypothetical protein
LAAAYAELGYAEKAGLEVEPPAYFRYFFRSFFPLLFLEDMNNYIITEKNVKKYYGPTTESGTAGVDKST